MPLVRGLRSSASERRLAEGLRPTAKPHAMTIVSYPAAHQVAISGHQSLSSVVQRLPYATFGGRSARIAPSANERAPLTGQSVESAVAELIREPKRLDNLMASFSVIRANIAETYKEELSPAQNLEVVQQYQNMFEVLHKQSKATEIVGVRTTRAEVGEALRATSELEEQIKQYFTPLRIIWKQTAGRIVWFSKTTIYLILRVIHDIRY